MGRVEGQEVWEYECRQGTVPGGGRGVSKKEVGKGGI